MKVDYKNTVFLPKTDFAMKANLATREPEFLEQWNNIDLYATLRRQSKDRKKFIQQLPMVTKSSSRAGFKGLGLAPRNPLPLPHAGLLGGLG